MKWFSYLFLVLFIVPNVHGMDVASDSDSDDEGAGIFEASTQEIYDSLYEQNKEVIDAYLERHPENDLLKALQDKNYALLDTTMVNESKIPLSNAAIRGELQVAIDHAQAAVQGQQGGIPEERPTHHHGAPPQLNRSFFSVDYMTQWCAGGACVFGLYIIAPKLWHKITTEWEDDYVDQNEEREAYPRSIGWD